MELYLLRHAIAEDHAPGGGGDEARRLTDEGRARMRLAACGMRWLGISADALLASPLVRARQTAEIVADELGLALREEPALAPGCTVARLRQALGDGPPPARMIVVGHEPDLSQLAGELTGGSRVQIKKAALARVDLPALERGAGVLVWLLPPVVLRRLGQCGQR